MENYAEKVKAIYPEARISISHYFKTGRYFILNVGKDWPVHSFETPEEAWEGAWEDIKSYLIRKLEILVH